MIYIFWSCRDRMEAKKIIHQLLDQRLIACASIFPEVESIYRWQGKVEEAREVKVILKTAPNHFIDIENSIKTQCSYTVPEIVQLSIDQCSSAYLSWILHECRFDD